MMHQRTPMGSKTTKLGPAILDAGRRKSGSWIDRFVETTDNLGAPRVFREWSAICTVAATLEQKVWLRTSSDLYANMYVFLVAHPGVGKTRTVRKARSYYAELPEPHLAPTSMTGSAMVDALVRSKRTYVQHPEPPKEYNSMYITADELGAFMHKYDNEAVGILSAFYDNDAYGQERRGNDIRIKIKSPQINLLCGTTPSNLISFMPDIVWEQGFTSRIMMIFSDERVVMDDFANEQVGLDKDLLHDLKTINGLHGKFGVTEDYRNAVNEWRALGEPPVPNHPKLIHYATRRRVHLYKLSMVSAVDRSNTLLLTKSDFQRAYNWLCRAESLMPDVFKAGAGNADSNAIDEIFHFVLTSGHREWGMAEQKIVNFARERIPLHSIMRIVDIMEQTGKITFVGKDQTTGQRYFRAAVPKVDMDGDLA